MEQNLETLKKVLWQQFEKAVERQGAYDDPNASSNGGQYGGGKPANFAIQGRQSIADLANAIANVEREIRESADNERKLNKSRLDV